MGELWRAGGRRLLFRAAAVAGVAVLVVGAAGGVAAAHSQLVGSEPTDGATVQVAPVSVELRFSQRLGAGFAAVAVTGPGGTPVEAGPATVDGPRVVVPLGALPAPGRYAVAYRVVSADGHPVSGEIGFTVASVPTTSPTASLAGTPSSADPAVLAAATAAAPAAPAAAPGDGGLNAWVVAAVVAGAVVAGGAGAWVGTRRRGRGLS